MIGLELALGLAFGLALEFGFEFPVGSHSYFDRPFVTGNK